MPSIDLEKMLGVESLPVYLGLVTQQIHKLLDTSSETLSKPLTRLLSGKGKQIRPALLIAICRTLGKEVDDQVISACVAVELLHVASLIHDDIIDDSKQRWKTQTINEKEGASTAILAGDYLIAKAMEEAASVNAHVAGLLAGAFSSLCEGQSLELENKGNLKVTEQTLYNVMKAKTASLMSVACQIAAVCGDMSLAESKALANYGEDFGIVFQLADDALDFISTPELLGKPTNSDLAEGLFTLPVITSLKSNSKKDLINFIRFNNFDKAADLLFDNGSISQSLRVARQYARSAGAHLVSINNDNLKNFPNNYLNWVITNQTSEKYKSVLD